MDTVTTIRLKDARPCPQAEKSKKLYFIGPEPKKDMICMSLFPSCQLQLHLSCHPKYWHQDWHLCCIYCTMVMSHHFSSRCDSSFSPQAADRHLVLKRYYFWVCLLTLPKSSDSKSHEITVRKAQRNKNHSFTHIWCFITNFFRT